MAINSHAFGRVTLTDDDAKKFSRQIKFGRSSATAKMSVQRGQKLNDDFKSGGKVTIQVRPRKKDKVVD